MQSCNAILKVVILTFQFPCKNHSGYVTFITIRFKWCKVKVSFNVPKWVLLFLETNLQNWFLCTVFKYFNCELWMLKLDKVLRKARTLNQLSSPDAKCIDWIWQNWRGVTRICSFSYVRELFLSLSLLGEQLHNKSLSLFVTLVVTQPIT